MGADTTYTLAVQDILGTGEHIVTVRDKGAEQFAARFRKVAKERRRWAAAQGISCYRIYDADLPDFACAIDLYEGTPVVGESSAFLTPNQRKALNGAETASEGPQRYLHIAEYKAPANIDGEKAARRFSDVLALAPALLDIPPEQVFAKERRRDKGGSQYAWSEDARPSFPIQVQESGLTFQVDLNGYLDTGLFLDHRLTRRLVAASAKGKDFLNLFGYTGSATVYAATGGAASTTTVDLSQTYLDWARHNLELNGLAGERGEGEEHGGKHRLERGDAMRWLEEAREAHRKWDLVFVDPPTFSNSKAMGSRTWDVQRDHVDLLCRIKRVLAPEGVIIFSCNLRSFQLDQEALQRAHLQVEDISQRSIPEDFARNKRIHQCFLLRRE